MQPTPDMLPHARDDTNGDPLLRERTFNELFNFSPQDEEVARQYQLAAGPWAAMPPALASVDPFPGPSSYGLSAAPDAFAEPLPPPPPQTRSNFDGANTSSWLSPQEAREARAYWQGTYQWSSMPAPRLHVPLVVDPPAELSTHDLETESDMRPRKRRTTEIVTTLDGRAREQSPSDIVPARTSDGTYSGGESSPTTQMRLVNRDASFALIPLVPMWDVLAVFDATPLASTSAQAASATGTTFTDHSQWLPGGADADALVPLWSGQLDNVPAGMARYDASTASATQYPMALPGVNSPPTPAMSEASQYSGDSEYVVPSPHWGARPPSDTSSPAGIDLTFGMHAPMGDRIDALGLRVQQNNTMLPPIKSQSPQLGVDQPAASSSKTPSSGKGQSSMKQGKPWAKRKGPSFECTVLGQMCAARNLSKDTPGPFQCFLGGDKDPSHARLYDNWASFQHHLERCQPEDRNLWPRCHFCGEPIRAVDRPYEMYRHLAGGGGKARCKALKKLMDPRVGGRTTNGAIGDWLRERNLVIHTRFLGLHLAEDFYRAAYWNEGRDLPVDLEGKRRPGKKRKNGGK
ncbi:hypothetical protein AURDEDRAFT_169046 [Auricularia subglabra TFB-10046 SS5]|nr:hypothetical protein AURDEDRAFT_169046 [Auricularia subglabra TFB-10046 SS5]